ncbi:uncharacterized protein LOC121257018 isoform X2 [Juglans microcarpa x Juglans regia]|uniref:uncharacterized protein LOC121257018 isoform X2 n=2 Tax=Juglans microcarpa x Juglans regia TaxID=2249226 RepID=UPI001B7F2F8F|nr:uncharacterized protein LOC121257018 isoform X2 [Juglans microcarpa x Juglans regia]XP_041013805.1 uncharacterized protein LOC121257018 isoform X2 [Juglans microcarpa x Juglans regia]XP_041013806.1 uncharacterized protein LOC121257018 isoform X2 [Juglans microcarpa x Juglans regia]XP_041013807.1 uncharacterized protein LOC121257018 isoform X2 [Juglans microcarpa x Juglans regia]XP_041013808.1 uncharacterized protein LOC121257018 isoform X2 [Juglans microcarpa x Juglans regia]
MAWRSGSLSRSLLTTAKSSSRSSSPPLPRLRPPPLAPPSVQSRHLSFASPAPRNLGELGCTQSLLPLGNVLATTRLTSHLSVNVRAFCELSHGTFRRTCQDR